MKVEVLYNFDECHPIETRGLSQVRHNFFFPKNYISDPFHTSKTGFKKV